MFMRELFIDKLDTDTRVPILTYPLTTPYVRGLFQVLFSAHGNKNTNTTEHQDLIVQIVAPSLFYFIQKGIIVLLQSALSVIFAVAIYEFVVKKRDKSSVQAFFNGFAIILPCVFYLPYWFVRVLDVKNNSFVFLVTTTPVLVLLRCSEAMFGTAPAHVESSFSNYATYYGSVAQFEFDPKNGKFVNISRKVVQQRLWMYVKSTILAGILFSVLHPRSYKLFDYDSSGHDHDDKYAKFRLLHWKHLLNNFSIAYLLYHSFVSLSCQISLLTSFITGIQTIKSMDDPLLLSSSPSDFWSRRWNLIVQGLLKRGVYIPVRKTFSSLSSPILGLILTFIVSGLIHEFILHVLSLKCPTLSMVKESCDITRRNQNDFSSCCVPVRYGNHFMFFLWNAMIIFLQYQLTKIVFCRQFVSKLPSFVITLLTLLTALPVAHWFLDEYVQTNFIPDLKLGFPLFVVREK